MICEHCGTEHALGADYVCRDVLKTQLAIETKRAEEAELRSEARGEQWKISNARCVELLAENQAAEAKLATAVEALQKAARWADDNKIFYHHVGGPGCASDVLHEIGKAALNTLRALGIDPSKETP